MRVSHDFSQFGDLEQTLKQARLIYPKRLARGAMNRAAAPVRDTARMAAPVGRGGQRVSMRLARRAQSRGTDPNEYRRGGATRSDIRIKSVSDPQVLAKTLVGVSKRRGKVGWRTHFLTMGTRKMRPRDFLTIALRASGRKAQEIFGDDFKRRVKFYLEGKRYRRVDPKPRRR